MSKQFLQDATLVSGDQSYKTRNSMMDLRLESNG